MGSEEWAGLLAIGSFFAGLPLLVFLYFWYQSYVEYKSNLEKMRLNHNRDVKGCKGGIHFFEAQYDELKVYDVRKSHVDGVLFEEECYLKDYKRFYSGSVCKYCGLVVDTVYKEKESSPVGSSDD